MILYLGRLLPTFLTRNFDEKTEAPQEHTEREKQFFEELGEGILEVLPDGYGFLRAENCLPGQMMCMFLRRRFADLI